MIGGPIHIIIVSHHASIAAFACVNVGRMRAVGTYMVLVELLVRQAQIARASLEVANVKSAPLGLEPQAR